MLRRVRSQGVLPQSTPPRDTRTLTGTWTVQQMDADLGSRDRHRQRSGPAATPSAKLVQLAETAVTHASPRHFRAPGSERLQLRSLLEAVDQLEAEDAHAREQHNRGDTRDDAADYRSDDDDNDDEDDAYSSGAYSSDEDGIRQYPPVSHRAVRQLAYIDSSDDDESASQRSGSLYPLAQLELCDLDDDTELRVYHQDRDAAVRAAVHHRLSELALAAEAARVALPDPRHSVDGAVDASVTSAGCVSDAVTQRATALAAEEHRKAESDAAAALAKLQRYRADESRKQQQQARQEAEAKAARARAEQAAKEKAATAQRQQQQQQRQQQEQKQQQQQQQQALHQQKKQSQQASAPAAAAAANTTTAAASTGRAAGGARVDADGNSTAALAAARVFRSTAKALEQRVATYDRDEAVRLQRKQFKKQIHLAVTQISNSLAQVHQKVQHLQTVMGEAKKAGPNAFAWSLDMLASKLVGRGDTQVHVQRSLAFPVSIVAVLTARQVPELVPLLRAKFLIACPYTVPWYPVRKTGMDEEAWRERLRYARVGDKWETTEQYTERMQGFVALYGAILQVEAAGFVNPFPVSLAWAWLAAVMNCPPRPITPSILLAMLEMAGYRLWQTYPRQFRKLMLALQQQLVPRLPQGNAAAVARLESFVSDFLRTGSLDKPEGHDLPP